MHMTKARDSFKGNAVTAHAVAGAPEIKLTDAMIEAGVAVLRASDRDYDADEVIAVRLFEAMAGAARLPICEASENLRSIVRSHWWHP